MLKKNDIEVQAMGRVMTHGKDGSRRIETGRFLPVKECAVRWESTALVKRFLQNSSWNRGSALFRKLAGVCIGTLGLYFVGQPIMNMI